MQLLNGWLRLAIIGVCSAAIGLSGACKPSTGKSSTNSSKSSSEKKAGEKKSGAKDKEGGEKKGGGKKGGGKKGGGKKGGGKKGGGKKGAAKGGEKSSATQGKQAAGKQAKDQPAPGAQDKAPSEGGKGEKKAAGGSKSSRSGSGDQAARPLEGIAFTVPVDWKASKAEKEVAALRGCYELPAPGGVEGKAVVLIHHQPDAKDKAKETLTKFFAKVKPAGDAKDAAPKFTEETTPDGIKITVGDVTGIVASRDAAADGGKDTTVRIIAAVIEDSKGPHTVRLTGPKAVVDGSADSFLAFVRSVKPQT